MNDHALLMTGATGALGRRLVLDLLDADDRPLYLVARRKRIHSARERVRRLLASGGREAELGRRVTVLEGDVTRPGFGLDDRDRLRREVGTFFHVAALTDLNGSADRCERINVGGTTEALRLAADLCERGVLERHVHFSTAYVAGSLRPMHAMEDALPPDRAFANHYEASKYEAERRVRGAIAEGLPAAIVRPSIVVGDSRTGATTEFNVIYPFMKLFAHGILTTLPAHPDDAFNVVPIDYVSHAVLAIARRPDAIGKTYHLVSERPPTIGTLLKVKDVEFPTMPHVELVDPARFAAERRGPIMERIRQHLEPYLVYLRCPLTFDTTNTRAALEGTGIAPPETGYDFLHRIVRYAVDQRYLIA